MTSFEKAAGTHDPAAAGDFDERTKRAYCDPSAAANKTLGDWDTYHDDSGTRPTIDDVRAALLRLKDAEGLDQAHTLLKRVSGCENLAELAERPQTFQKVITAADKLAADGMPVYIGFSPGNVLAEAFEPALKASRERGPKAGVMVFGSRLVCVESSVRGLHLITLGEQSAAAALIRAGIRFRKSRGGDSVPADCPPALIRAILGSTHLLPEISIRAIAQTPILVGGQLIATPGFHRESGTWIHSPTVCLPEPCDRAAAIRALAYLKGWLGEFPFASEVDRAVALSLMLTAAMRASLSRAPGGVITKPSYGAGASTLCDLVVVTLTGGPAAAINASKTREELDKEIDAVQLAGGSYVCLDNIPDGASFNSTAVAQLLSQEQRQIRILGKSEAPTLPNSQLVLLNGVNTRVGDDLVRRFVLLELDPRIENPENRTFRRPTLVADLQRDRVKVLQACYTIAIAYQQSGARVSAQPLAGFDTWRQMVQEPLIWLDEADPVQSQRKLAFEDPAKALLLSLFRAWECLFGDKPVSASQLLREATDVDVEDESLDAPKRQAQSFGRAELTRVLDEVSRDRSGKQTAKQLGYFLRGKRGRVVSNFRLEAAGAERDGTAMWRLRSLKFEGDAREIDERHDGSELSQLSLEPNRPPEVSNNARNSRLMDATPPAIGNAAAADDNVARAQGDDLHQHSGIDTSPQSEPESVPASQHSSPVQDYVVQAYQGRSGSEQRRCVQRLTELGIGGIRQIRGLNGTAVLIGPVSDLSGAKKLVEILPENEFPDACIGGGAT